VSQEEPTSDTPPYSGPIHRRHVLYPDRYVWLVFFSALDIMITHTILGKFGAFGGREVNSIADWVIKEFGLWGAIGLKFLSVIVVVLVCEFVGRASPRTGRRLATGVLVLSTLPVAWELIILAVFAVRGPS
jgi:hypothetical protein